VEGRGESVWLAWFLVATLRGFADQASARGEPWMPPEGGVMLGASRTTVHGAVREVEQLRLDADGEGLVYTARPSGQTEAAFRSEQVSDTGFVVANPAHDFPRRIGYRRSGSDSLVAWIEGPGAAGTTRIEYPMRRVDCRGTAS
jgi:hypothetical protein